MAEMGKSLYQIEPVAVFHSPLTDKFGLPRQAGLAESLEGWIELEPEFRHEEALRGLADFDYLWLIWGFHLNRPAGASGKSGLQSAAGASAAPGAGERSELQFVTSGAGDCGPENLVQCARYQLTVRPPRLGGNARVGVFASRSPFRPNGMGLSSVRISRIEGCRIYVLGADLADGTPIFDIKPYVEYADSHPGVRSGFVDARAWETLEIVFPPEYQVVLESAGRADMAVSGSGISGASSLRAGLGPDELMALREILEQDPRPQFHHDPEKVYGLSFGSHNVRFRVDGSRLEVLSISAQA